MEASGLGGATMTLVLVPGLLAAGVGSLVFIGLDAWTGFGTTSLVLPGLPQFGRPDIAQFGWALVIGLLAAVLGSAIRWLALFLRPHVERRLLLITPVVGLVVAGLAIAYAEGTGKSTADVLFSGQSQMGPLLTHSAGYSVAALLLVACKGLAYSASLSGFRGGPVFPSMFIGAAGGMARSHLPGRITQRCSSSASAADEPAGMVSATSHTSSWSNTVPPAIVSAPASAPGSRPSSPAAPRPTSAPASTLSTLVAVEAEYCHASGTARYGRAS